MGVGCETRGYLPSDAEGGATSGGVAGGSGSAGKSSVGGRLDTAAGGARGGRPSNEGGAGIEGGEGGAQPETGGVPGEAGGTPSNTGGMANGAATSSGGLGGTGGMPEESAGAAGHDPADPCDSLHCQHGSCVAERGVARCACADGYQGSLCETNTDDCVGHACKNQSTCVDQVDGYVCRCPEGFSGTYCEKKVASCADMPCAHSGVCSETSSSYTCRCPPEYQGSNCVEDVDECRLANACAHGLCTNTNGGYQCNCSGTEYQGTKCELLSPKLTADKSSYNFGILEVGVASTTIALTLTNTGDVATGAISRTVNGAVTASAGCTQLAAHASCTVQVGFTAVSGASGGSIQFRGAAGGQFTFAVTAEGQYRLTVARPGTAAGRVTSSPAGIDCSAANAAGCSALFPYANVTLTARTTNGSDSFFSGWSDPCVGPRRDCSTTVSSSQTITANFAAMTKNLIFVTKDRFSATLGSATAYDAKCNAVASSAGLNNAAGTGFVAFTSDSQSLARTRLGNARGWIRVDGQPFADTQASLFGSHQTFNSIAYNETGEAESNEVILTGTLSNGELGSNCSDWTDPAGTFTYGIPTGGPHTWGGGDYKSNGFTCAATNSIKLMCMGITKTAAVSAVSTSGRKVWISNTPFVAGAGQTPDQKCQAERPSGVTSAAALIGYSNKAATDRLTADAKYVRPDGTLVGTGAQLTTQLTLQSGIWQSADGSYKNVSIWTGSKRANALGANTCGDWANPNVQGTIGISAYTTSWWDNSDSFVDCDYTEVRLYCVQTTP